MGLSHRCQSSFSPRVLERGDRYFEDDNVSVQQLSSTAAVMTVYGTLPYEVLVDWSQTDRGIVLARCSCPHFEGGNWCKHIWASLLEVDAHEVGDHIRGQRPLEMRIHDGDAPRGRGLESRNPVHRNSPQDSATSWREVMSLRRPGRDYAMGFGADYGPGPDKPPRPTEPVIVRRVCFFIDPVEVMRTGSLELMFYQRLQGKMIPFRPRHDDIFGFSPNDQRLIAEVLGSADRNDPYAFHVDTTLGASVVTIDPRFFLTLLPRLCQNQQLRLIEGEQADESGAELRWDDGEPWKPQLTTTRSEKGTGLRVAAQLIRDDEIMPLPVPDFLLSSGLLIAHNTLSRLEHGGYFEWIVALRKHPYVEVPPQEEHEFLLELHRKGDFPTPLPDELHLEVADLDFTPCLSIERHDGRRRQILGRLHFRYGSAILDFGEHYSAYFELDDVGIVRRQLRCELDCGEVLSGLGLSHDAYRENCYVITKKRFESLVDELLDLGWLVHLDGSFVRRPSTPRISVESGTDWFDVHGTVDFDGTEVGLPEVLRALRRGDKSIVLADGSKGYLNHARMDQLAHLLDFSTEHDGALRFHHMQAAVLDALLAPIENVSFDARYGRVLERLANFATPQPLAAPRGFRGELRDYQQAGLGWMAALQKLGLGGCLADDMGLGKTVQVLALLQRRRSGRRSSDQTSTTSLIVVPRSLVHNWKSEAERFTPMLVVRAYHGSDRKALLSDLGATDVVITTYGTMRRDILELKDIAFDYVILDEAQAIKNTNSQTAKATRLLQCTNRLALTGTPVENHLQEVWSLFEFLNPGLLGASSRFQKLVRSKGKKQLEIAKQVGHMLRPFLLRRTKGEVLSELPPKTEQVLHCEMNPRQRKLYEELRDHYRQQLTQTIDKQGMAKSKMHVLEALLRLRQVACHPGLVDPVHETVGSAKIETLIHHLVELSQEGHKALVFSQFTSLLAIVQTHLRSAKIPFAYLDGKTRKRGAVVDAFQSDPECPVFLISLKAGGHGLNLTAADYVFLLDPWWNPAVEAQAVDRAHRIGQTRSVMAYRLISKDTVEEKILELQANKRELADAILQANSNVIGSMTREDLEVLLGG